MYFGGVFGPLKKQAYDEGMAAGIADGMAVGTAKGMASLLLGMLASKFGMVPDAVMSKIEGAPVDALTLSLGQQYPSQKQPGRNHPLSWVTSLFAQPGAAPIQAEAATFLGASTIMYMWDLTAALHSRSC